jgi:hypothetical protein
MSVAQKEMVVSCHDLNEIVKSLENESVLGKNFEGAVFSLRQSSCWVEQESNPRNGKVLPNAYFSWKSNSAYDLVVPPNFDKPSRLEVRTHFNYLIDKDSKGLPDVQMLSKAQVTERVYAGMGMTSQRINNTRRCIFDPLVNLDILFKLTIDSGANLDQIVERFSNKKIGFNPSTVGFDFAELESPVCFNQRSKHKGYLLISLKSGHEMKINVVYRPQV